MKILTILSCGIFSTVILATAQQDQAPAESTAVPAFTLAWSKAEPIKLIGPHATHQLVLTAKSTIGADHDVTHSAKYGVLPEGIIDIDPSGFVRAYGDGTATVTATTDGVTAAPFTISVQGFGKSIPVSFPNDVVPIFTRFECNSGGCHGKAEGQNSFRLSLLGYESAEDYEYLVKESRGRRIFRAAPEHSLLLLKASGELPHRGGSRLETGQRRLQTHRALDPTRPPLRPQGRSQRDTHRGLPRRNASRGPKPANNCGSPRTSATAAPATSRAACSMSRKTTRWQQWPMNTD